MRSKVLWLLLLFFAATSLQAQEASIVFKRLLKAEIVTAKQTKESERVGKAVKTLDGTGILDRVIKRFLKEMQVNVKSSNTTEDGCYVCETCGFIYDPDDGDSEQEIKVGTSFTALPRYWVCPICENGKSSFKKLVD